MTTKSMVESRRHGTIPLPPGSRHKKNNQSTWSITIKNDKQCFLILNKIYIYIYIYIYIWTLTYGRAKAGRPARTYIQKLWGYGVLALKTSWRRWTKGRSGEWGSGISVVVTRHDDIYIYIYIYIYITHYT